MSDRMAEMLRKMGEQMGIEVDVVHLGHKAREHEAEKEEEQREPTAEELRDSVEGIRQGTELMYKLMTMVVRSYDENNLDKPGITSDLSSWLQEHLDKEFSLKDVNALRKHISWLMHALPVFHSILTTSIFIRLERPTHPDDVHFAAGDGRPS